jgi:hypothetical protein
MILAPFVVLSAPTKLYRFDFCNPMVLSSVYALLPETVTLPIGCKIRNAFGIGHQLYRRRAPGPK